MNHTNRCIRSTLSLAFILLFLAACSSTPSIDVSSQLKLQTARYGHASATDGKRIFVFAGSRRGKFLSDIEIIDPLTGEVTVLKNKVIPRRYFSAVWDGKESIYLIGGVSYRDTVDAREPRVEIFNIRSYEVTLGSANPVPRRNSRAVLLDNHIYVLGGSAQVGQNRQGSASTPLNVAYDIESDKWKRMADMPTAKSTAPIMRDGLLYVAGGFNHAVDLDVFEQFNPVTNQWVSLAAMPRPVSAHSAVYAQNKLFLFGDYKRLDSVLMYDFTDQKWSEPTFEFQGSRHNTTVVIGGVLYVIGGNVNSRGSSLDRIQRFQL